MASAPILPFPTVPPMPAVARILSRFQRPQLEAFIMVAIELLDVLDGDCDGEDDDPGGTEIDKAELDESFGVMLPKWGVDQSLGPINELEANRDQYLKIIGLSRC